MDEPATLKLRDALSRREWLRRAVAVPVAVAAARRLEASPPGDVAPASPLFQISLAQWSLHRALHAGKLDHLDFPRKAKSDFGIDAVEYVNSFFKEKGKQAYVEELRKRCADLGVRSVLIMCDGEGRLGDPDVAKRKKAVANHRPWLEAASALGCKAIRVNAYSEGDYAEQRDRAADGLHLLAEAAEPFGLFVIVENHGGFSSNGAWLASVIKAADHRLAGTLPDFGNFRVGPQEEYDRYRGVVELMPFARGVSAKSYAFDARGDESTMDYRRLLRTVVDAGYTGYVGIEYEGSAVGEDEGILATKRLLERVREELSAERAASRAASTSRPTESRPLDR